MMDSTPYSKREIDQWRSDVSKQLDVVQASLKDINENIFYKGEMYADTVNKLAKISSDNSGQILALWEAMKKEQKATKLIDDIASFGLVTKWIFYFVVSLGSLYATLKLLASSWVITHILK